VGALIVPSPPLRPLILLTPTVYSAHFTRRRSITEFPTHKFSNQKLLFFLTPQPYASSITNMHSQSTAGSVSRLVPKHEGDAEQDLAKTVTNKPRAREIVYGLSCLQ
jgi:hypothetical protein